MATAQNSGPVIRSLQGAWMLASLDRDGLRCFDFSVEGFWRSFRAPVVALPLFLIMVLLERDWWQDFYYRAADPATLDFSRFYPVFAADYLLSWVMFPVVIYPVLKICRLERQFVPLVVSINWARIMLLVIRLPVMALSMTGFLSDSLLFLALLLTYGLMLYYLWFVARTALEQGGGRRSGAALMVVITEIALSFLLVRVITLILGDPVTSLSGV